MSLSNGPWMDDFRETRPFGHVLGSPCGFTTYEIISCRIMYSDFVCLATLQVTIGVGDPGLLRMSLFHLNTLRNRSIAGTSFYVRFFLHPGGLKSRGVQCSATCVIYKTVDHIIVLVRPKRTLRFRPIMSR